MRRDGLASAPSRRRSSATSATRRPPRAPVDAIALDDRRGYLRELVVASGHDDAPRAPSIASSRVSARASATSAATAAGCLPGARHAAASATGARPAAAAEQRVRPVAWHRRALAIADPSERARTRSSSSRCRRSGRLEAPRARGTSGVRCRQAGAITRRGSGRVGGARARAQPSTRRRGAERASPSTRAMRSSISTRFGFAAPRERPAAYLEEGKGPPLIPTAASRTPASRRRARRARRGAHGANATAPARRARGRARARQLVERGSPARRAAGGARAAKPTPRPTDAAKASLRACSSTTTSASRAARAAGRARRAAPRARPARTRWPRGRAVAHAARAVVATRGRSSSTRADARPGRRHAQAAVATQSSSHVLVENQHLPSACRSFALDVDLSRRLRQSSPRVEKSAARRGCGKRPPRVRAIVLPRSCSFRSAASATAHSLAVGLAGAVDPGGRAAVRLLGGRRGSRMSFSPANREQADAWREPRAAAASRAGRAGR